MEQKSVKLTMDAFFDETDDSWNTTGMVDKRADNLEVADVIAEFLKAYSPEIAMQVAVCILNGGLIEGEVTSKRTIIDLDVIKRARGEG